MFYHRLHRYVNWVTVVALACLLALQMGVFGSGSIHTHPHLAWLIGLFCAITAISWTILASADMALRSIGANPVPVAGPTWMESQYVRWGFACAFWVLAMLGFTVAALS
jgi:hypothetical protein